MMQTSARLIEYARNSLVRRTDNSSVIRLFSLYKKSDSICQRDHQHTKMTLCKCLTHIKRPQAIRVDNGNGRICNAMQYVHAKIKANARINPNSTPANVAQNHHARSPSRLDSFVLLHEFHEGFLVHETRILPVLEDTKVPEAQLGKTLVDQVDGGVDVQGDRSLMQVSTCASVSKGEWKPTGSI